MSLINKMLQELDKRHAARGEPAAGQEQQVAQNVRAVKSEQVGSEIFWRTMAVMLVAAVAWVAWVAWQIMPHSVVTDNAFQSGNRARAPQPAANVAAAPAPLPVTSAPVAEVPPSAAPAPTAAVPAQPSAASPALAAPAQPAAARPAAAKSEAANGEPKGQPNAKMLRLATEIATPIAKSTTKAAPKPADHQVVAAVKPQAQAAKAPDDAAAATPRPPRSRVATADFPGRIDKRVGATPRERAETEFQRAMAQVNEGRMAEGMEGLRAALAADPGYEVARQTLVGLLLEAKRTDDAATAAREGLEINPANAGFAVVLARISVERNDLDGALALLKKYESAAQNNAEYHAFVAALYQRRSRHAEAIEQYRIALRLTSTVGAWWVGLGISQEASERPKDASESFLRAKASGNLSAELVAYVDRRLKQLQ